MVLPRNAERMLRTFSMWLWAVGLLCAPMIAWGDVFLLKSGGQIEGEWINRGERRSAGQEIRTPGGIRLKLAAEQVDTRIPQPKADDEYQQIAPTFANTVDAHWELAEWCRDKNLPDRRKVHLEAILAFDTNHVAARRALGYQQFRGEWQTREEFHRREGYELYRGRWRLTQDIEIQEEQAKRELAAKEWLMRLKRWRAELSTERGPLAYQRFEQLDEPAAIPALQYLLQREAMRRVKIVYLDALLRIGNAAAAQAILSAALNDADEEIFYESTDRLKKLSPQLVLKPLLDALREKSNVKINRAAYILGKVGDPTIFSPLIDALISVQRIANPQAGGDTTSFGSDGSFGMSRGGPAAVDVPVQNQFVLEALIELTGQNFEFDQRAWRRWYNIEKQRIFAENARVDLRREDSNQRPR